MPNMYYEAEEFARLIREGKIESQINSYEQSLQVMAIMERARKDMGGTVPSRRELI